MTAVELFVIWNAVICESPGAILDYCRKPACCNSGSTRATKNGNSSLKLTNDSDAVAAAPLGRAVQRFHRRLPFRRGVIGLR
jgi:hypothetical protein